LQVAGVAWCSIIWFYAELEFDGDLGGAGGALCLCDGRLCGSGEAG